MDGQRGNLLTPPDVFAREHDAILLATPFRPLTARPLLPAAHDERIGAAVMRGFLRSVRHVEQDGLHAALEASCTVSLHYQLTVGIAAGRWHALTGYLLTCRPHAHLALTSFLEHDAVFTAEMIGRVTRRV